MLIELAVRGRTGGSNRDVLGLVSEGLDICSNDLPLVVSSNVTPQNVQSARRDSA